MTYIKRLFLFLAVVPIVAEAQTVCRASNKLSSNLIGEITSMLTTNDSLRIALTVPVVPASQVVLATDEATCARALRVQDSVIAASNSRYSPPYPSRQLYVVKVGIYYASLDTNGNRAEWQSVYFWDDRWRFLGFFSF